MIYLVRHGQSEWNLLRRTQGQIPHPQLTDLGRRQASAAAQAIRADAELTGQAVRSAVAIDWSGRSRPHGPSPVPWPCRSTSMGAGMSSASDGSKGWDTKRPTPSWR